MDELGASELGTKEFWDQRYQDEIQNFEKHGDPGEIWFGEDSTERVINWMIRQKLDKNAKIIDLGCGNGMFLIELAREGYTNLHGVDYSPDAVVLAQKIAEKQELVIQFSTCDVLAGIDARFAIVHDKGTYDAISLNENAKDFREKYIDSVFKSVENDGFFVITSCNWTESELAEQFAGKFKVLEVIPTPQFKFGGKVGNVVTSLVFVKDL